VKQLILFLIDHAAARVARAAVAYAAGKKLLTPGIGASGDVQNWATKVGMLYAGQTPTYTSPDEQVWIEEGKALADVALDYVLLAYKVDLTEDDARLGVMLQAVSVALAARFPQAVTP
jgi:hypothetical protein